MHDVAARAGVSHQTVSRVLNDFAGIRPATRERVKAAIAELGYRPNISARTLATGRSEAVGVLAPETPNYGPLSTLYAIQRACRAQRLHAVVTSSSHDDADIADALDFLIGRSVDALVVIAQRPGVVQTVEALVNDLPVAYVMTGHPVAHSAVSADQTLGTLMVLEHLYELGHRHLQYVAGPLDFTEAAHRHAAFIDFVERHGLVHYELLHGDWSAATGHDAGQRVDPRVTAVVCANDQMAQGLIHALEGRGVHVPAHVSVSGFDDIPESAYFRPALTTVHQDFVGVGERAIEMLVARMRGEPASEPDPLSPVLVVRQSTAPPRA